MVSVRHGRAAIGCVLVLLAGCHLWRRDPQALVQPLGERTRIQLWSRGEVRVVHGVRVRGDSVVAVPYWLPPRCDSCAVRLPLSLVDSVRVQQPAATRTLILEGGLLAVGITIVWIAVEIASIRD
jgi:hypothetical protein